MKRRQPVDLYTDTMLWIMDGRRSWNRKPHKPSARANSSPEHALATRKHRRQSSASRIK